MEIFKSEKKKRVNQYYKYKTGALPTPFRNSFGAMSQVEIKLLESVVIQITHYDIISCVFSARVINRNNIRDLPFMYEFRPDEFVFLDDQFKHFEEVSEEHVNIIDVLF